MQDMNESNPNKEKKEQPESTLMEELKQPPQEDPMVEVKTDALRAEAKQRAKQRPIMHKILKFIRREDQTYRELIINSEPLEKRVALLVDGILEKFEVERSGEDRKVGAIYKGKIFA